MPRLLLFLCAIASTPAACNGKPPPSARNRATASANGAAASVASSGASSAATNGAPLFDAGTPRVFATVDAGPSPCRVLYGPVAQPWVGEAVLAPTGSGIDVVTHRNGVPSVVSIASAEGKPGRVPRSDPPSRASSPACSVAGAYVYCMDASGAIRRTPRAGGSSTTIAQGRFGTRFDAESLGEAHAVVAFLSDNKTSEGTVTQAYAVLDDTPPVRVSEEGSGATYVTLSPRATDVVAMMIDARAAMTPVHARALALSPDGKLVVGADAVVFVGGTSERRTAGVVGTPKKGRAFGLLPLANDEGFGMAAIAIDEEPRVDAPTRWSLYPNGLDPAPIAATVQSSPIRVARVRPLDPRPDATRGIELGQLDDEGRWGPLGFLATTGPVANVAIAADARGALWIHYTDAAGSWVERRMCP